MWTRSGPGSGDRERAVTTNYLQWVEVSRSALSANIGQFRGLIGPRRKLLAVVKANAYGHGLLEIARLALGDGVDWLGVHSLEEGTALRDAGIEAPILVLGYVGLRDLEDAVARDLRLIVYNTETVDALARVCRKLGKPAILHLKTETGTHRQGVFPQRLFALASRIRRAPGLILEGLSSHFANIEDTTDHRYPQRQLQCFQQASSALEKRGVHVPIRHMSCTASTILFPDTYFNMVRVGIGLYGLWPSKETYLSCLLQKREPLSLLPVLSWKSRVAQLKAIPKDSFIGYGCTFRTTRKTMLAVVPVGYAEGYDRGFSNSAHVLIKGKRAPLIGRVAMDFITVDATDIPGVRIEEEVVLIGRSGKERLTAEYLASLAGTISYEIVARINPSLRRVVVR